MRSCCNSCRRPSVIGGSAEATFEAIIIERDDVITEMDGTLQSTRKCFTSHVMDNSFSSLHCSNIIQKNILPVTEIKHDL